MSTRRSSIHPVCEGHARLVAPPLGITSKPPHRGRISTQPRSPVASQPSRANQIRNRLRSIAEHLGRDELAVLILIAERLRAGRRVYGDLNLATDTRDFAREALEEAADMAVYAAAGLLKTKRKRRAFKNRFSRVGGG